MLDERAQVLLKALVERYISDGQPVGSRTLAHQAGLDLSAATIRNVMAEFPRAFSTTKSASVPTSSVPILSSIDSARALPRVIW